LADDPFALDDPLGEDHFLAAPRLVHQYRDRALLLAGGTCAGFCRYCFRRKRMPAAFITEEELKPVLGYLQAQSGIREILVSGGDPLTAADAELEWLFEEIRKARPGILIRICSRIPITNPGRINALAAALFARYMPLRLVTHINHPRELAPEARAALAHLVKTGIPVHVQTVLLRGINDNAETLAELFRECLNLGISPYYLFQLDLAPGTAHFRVPLKEGISLYKELKMLISGLGLPTYAVDLPGGGGKIRLHENVISGEDLSAGVYLLAGQDGKLWKYPAD
jgi:lysine 2,3-aminomutase